MVPCNRADSWFRRVGFIATVTVRNAVLPFLKSAFLGTAVFSAYEEFRGLVEPYLDQPSTSALNM